MNVSLEVLCLPQARPSATNFYRQTGNKLASRRDEESLIRENDARVGQVRDGEMGFRGGERGGGRT